MVRHTQLSYATTRLIEDANSLREWLEYLIGLVVEEHQKARKIKSNRGSDASDHKGEEKMA